MVIQIFRLDDEHLSASMFASLGAIHYDLFSRLKEYWINADDATMSLRFDIKRSSDVYIACMDNIPAGYVVLRNAFSIGIEEILQETSNGRKLLDANKKFKEIDWIGVDEKYGGKGIGSSLLNYVVFNEIEANTSALAAICWCGSNRSAMSLFLKNNFDKLAVKQDYFWTDSSEAVLLLRQLNN